MARVDDVALRFELLRTRAAIQRAELRAAVADLRDSTATMRSLVGVVSGRARTNETAGGGIAMLVRAIVGVLRERPWLLSAVAAVAGQRGMRRWLVLGAVAAVVAVVVRGAAAPARPSGAGRSTGA